MPKTDRHAIIYGASGLIGWAVVNQLLSSYPERGTFKKVTAVTNRPLNLAETHWPTGQPGQPELQLISGVDLRSAHELEHQIPDIETVTHVYYLAFTANSNALDEVAINSQMFSTVIAAHNTLSPDLEFVAFAGGTRGYGIYTPGGTFQPPLSEDLVHALPEDVAKTVVYPVYRQILTTASANKSWTWCEVCPDAIIGFTPNGSQFSLALHWAQYLSLYAYNHDVGPRTASGDREASAESGAVEVPFPGVQAAADAKFSPVSSATLVRFMVFASLRPGQCGGGRLFNVADCEEVTYGELWGAIAGWFGLVGGKPVEVEGGNVGDEPGEETVGAGEMPAGQGTVLTPGEYVGKYRDVFRRCGCERGFNCGVGAGARQLDSVGYWLTFDRQLDCEKLKATGFEPPQDPVQGWWEAFALFRDAGLIL
ncbi:uncharacterized protein BO97DRAFT_409335 [Aspergillus homomorphus CBS 101889]|uniref:PRISE-like Rossmann-fold domain-containing protein n=1 Tax=Aspergillus homomorphus (strain CBS 101889) TaxID=1450537 RepID=A0A395HG98_ASPHC|nr:hypothetical protein BO97DRAFT_409335 [Aspergillus homomorphus CBS 101889]RAL06951.1 hypothetical protein BO97DRAFT_409335 [Aspergillus homomorphus CBS 101889]